MKEKIMLDTLTKPELFIKLYETCFAWLVKLFLTNSKLHLLSEKI
ncbi:hypothetical protein B0H39_003793 [Clostridium beijerinckii]|nr:hypothetical protein [Clostridium beijerinckii]NOW85912.1 hypothetical protein [Clostridium beijerinckii]